MTEAEVESRFATIRVWSARGERAPNKPLLLLYVLGRYIRGAERLLPFSEVKEPLKTLLEDFGKPGRTPHPNYPFWHLQNDGIWELETSEEIVLPPNRDSALVGELLRMHARAGLTSEIYDRVRRKPTFAAYLAQLLLDAAFADTVHEDILQAVGISIGSVTIRRDPQFRALILKAYEHRCAVCRFDARMGSRTIGLDAAHVKWHKAGGADTETNGLALCVLHHKLLDLGVWTISGDHRIEVSEQVVGYGRFREYVADFHGAELERPINPAYRLSPDSIAWHREQVFRHPARISAATS